MTSSVALRRQAHDIKGALSAGYLLCALWSNGLSQPLQAQSKPEGEMRWGL